MPVAAIVPVVLAGACRGCRGTASAMADHFYGARQGLSNFSVRGRSVKRSKFRDRSFWAI